MTQRNFLITTGEILVEESMIPLGISQNQITRDIDVPVSRISGIVKGERAITADTALRLAEYFKTSPDMWMTLQSEYDLRLAKAVKGLEIKARMRAFKFQTEAAA
jgi:antitoxin HigA-1